MKLTLKLGWFFFLLIVRVGIEIFLGIDAQ